MLEQRCSNWMSMLAHSRGCALHAHFVEVWGLLEANCVGACVDLPLHPASTTAAAAAAPMSHFSAGYIDTKQAAGVVNTVLLSVMMSCHVNRL
jgi:hypothetical protein